MDIKHLYYFLSIVEHNFNLSRAAESLYIVQPTLSTMINDFEKNEKVDLFNRKKGRIVGLTHASANSWLAPKRLLGDP